MQASFTAAVYLGMSVDGFIARLDGDLSWLTGGDEVGGSPDDGDLSWLTGGDEVGGSPDDGAGGDFGFAEFVTGIDALVMGRSTYEVIAPMQEWPYQGKPVHVLSTTLPEGADTRITVHRSFDDVVAALSAAGYRKVYVDGGRTAHTFLAAGLVSELTLTRVPVLIGTGLTPFGPLPADIALEHRRTEAFAGGAVQSTYDVR